MASSCQRGSADVHGLKLCHRFDAVAGPSAPTMAGRDVFDLIFALFATSSVNFAARRTLLECGVVITPANFAATNLWHILDKL